jgi:DNA-binding beta-propeller fold protein YncE
MFYDANSNRIFVTNPAANTITSLLAASDPPSIQFSATVAASPLSAALLPDQSRLYVASVSNSGGNASAQATVIDANNGTVRSTIPLNTVPAACIAGSRFQVSAAAASDSSRVYVAFCDAGDVSIITTLTDTKVFDLVSPVSAYPPPGPGEQPPPQQPVFLLAGQ